MANIPSHNPIRWIRSVPKRDERLMDFVGVLAWAIWVLSLALAASAGFVITTRQPHFFAQWPNYSDLLLALSFLPLGTLGALVAARRHASILGWLFLFANFMWWLYLSGLIYVYYVLPGHELVAAALFPLAEVSLLAIACSLLLFPEDRFRSAARPPVVWFLAGAVAAYSVTQIQHDPPLRAFLIANGVRIPLGISGRAGEVLYHLLSLTAGEAVVILLLALAAVSALVRIFVARGVERQQLKWFACAAILPTLGSADMLLDDWGRGAVLSGIGVSAMGVAVAIAILRYRLYDIDIIINRTLVYGSVTAVLAGVFAALSIVTQRVVLALTGQESQAAVVLAALVVTALFQPLRARVQIVVDRRFYRRKYDATQTLERFALHLREEVELDRLADGLVGVVQETMQPKHVSLWLRPSESEAPGRGERVLSVRGRAP